MAWTWCVSRGLGVPSFTGGVTETDGGAWERSGLPGRGRLLGISCWRVYLAPSPSLLPCFLSLVRGVASASHTHHLNITMFLPPHHRPRTNRVTDCWQEPPRLWFRMKSLFLGCIFFSIFGHVIPWNECWVLTLTCNIWTKCVSFGFALSYKEFSYF